MRVGKNTGSILIGAFWVLLILSLIAWGLSQRSAMEISLLETYQGKMRSYAAARAGINHVLDLMDTAPSAKDTLYNVGIDVPQGKTPKDIFAHIDVGPQAHAVVQWPAKGFKEGHATDIVYGLQDEQSKININAINGGNYKILSALFELKGLSQMPADALAMAIVNYKEMNSQLQEGWLHDAQAQALKPKNRPYEYLLELLHIEGMTKEIFEGIRDDLTVYGDAQNGLWVNINTANNDVIQALANAAVRDNAAADVHKITVQAYALRDGQDNQPFTSDDGKGSVGENITNWPPALRGGSSAYVRARVVGIDNVTKIRTVIEAVIHRTPGISNNRIIGWYRE